MKTSINRYTHKGIPTLEYSQPGNDRLIFVNHGIYGNKDQAMKLVGMTLVKLGYTVVALDAAKHGQRAEAPYKERSDHTLSRLYMFDVVKQTSDDILTLYQDKYRDKHDSFDVLGFSMGGYVTYYTASQSQRIKTIIPIISSPAFSKSNVWELPTDYKEKYQEEANEIYQRIQAMDPALHPEELVFDRAIILSGEHDQTVPKETTETFINDNPEFNIFYEVFDTGHQMVPAMQTTLKTKLHK